MTLLKRTIPSQILIYNIFGAFRYQNRLDFKNRPTYYLRRVLHRVLKYKVVSKFMKKQTKILY